MTEPKITEAIAALLSARDDALKSIGGCGDGNCCIIRPKGQHTNGGCRCAMYPAENRRNVEKALRVNQRFADAVSSALAAANAREVPSAPTSEELDCAWEVAKAGLASGAAKARKVTPQ